MMIRELSIQNDLQELGRLTAFLEKTAAEWGFGNDLLFHLNLVVEEVVSNIILYGFENERSGEMIMVKLTFIQGELKIYVTDHGREFNPLKVPPPDDLDKPASERQIGGLGIYFVRQLMDQIEYYRENDSNFLILTKKVS